MEIGDIGGEFKLIERITKKGGAIVGIGDDAAVMEPPKRRLQLITCDMLCEGDHFRLDWASPKQIGEKVMEVNVSDIAAMGGEPTYAVIALSLTEKTDVEFMDGLYEGIYASCERHGFKLIGGDTTRGKACTVSVTVLGEVEKENLSLRSDAKVGDLICVTGYLGGSTAGLNLLLRGVEGDTKDHLEPRCRLNAARMIAPHCNAMIDVSDGLASEVGHICDESGVGARVYKDRIPLSASTKDSAEKLGMDPYEFALSGGEDFELVFTIPEERILNIEVNCPITVVGEIVDGKEGRTLISGDGEQPLEGGYDHFSE